MKLSLICRGATSCDQSLKAKVSRARTSLTSVPLKHIKIELGRLEMEACSNQEPRGYGNVLVMSWVWAPAMSGSCWSLDHQAHTQTGTPGVAAELETATPMVWLRPQWSPENSVMATKAHQNLQDTQFQEDWMGFVGGLILTSKTLKTKEIMPKLFWMLSWAGFLTSI